jgi:hypothetical protein
VNTCAKCQKEYNPKRIGGRFCSVSCGNSYRQQLKRNGQKEVKAIREGYAIEKPLTNEEQILWSILFVLGVDAKRILADNELAVDKRPADIGTRIRTLLLNCQDKANSPMMKELSIRYEAQKEAEKRLKTISQQNSSK